jgi:hypothetical protein
MDPLCMLRSSETCKSLLSTSRASPRYVRMCAKGCRACPDATVAGSGHGRALASRTRVTPSPDPTRPLRAARRRSTVTPTHSVEVAVRKVASKLSRRRMTGKVLLSKGADCHTLVAS